LGLLFYEVIFVKTQEYLEDENLDEDGEEEETDSVIDDIKGKNVQ